MSHASQVDAERLLGIELRVGSSGRSDRHRGWLRANTRLPHRSAAIALISPVEREDHRGGHQVDLLDVGAAATRPKR